MPWPTVTENLNILSDFSSDLNILTPQNTGSLTFTLQLFFFLSLLKMIKALMLVFCQFQNSFNIVAFISHQADFQDVPFVLELAGHNPCSSTMQVCPQTGLPVWPVPPLRAGHPAIRQALLSLSYTSCYHTQTAQLTAKPAVMKNSTERPEWQTTNLNYWGIQ